MTPGSAFEGLGSEYDQWRPRYPLAIFAPLSRVLASFSDPLLVDVGSGTGISTRALREAVGSGPRIVGVEPDLTMRAEAFDATPASMNIEYRDGRAEDLPFPAASVHMLLAAQAYQWFDRPRFLVEARRCLARGALLGVVQNDRDWRAGGMAAAYEEFLETYSPHYSRDYRAFDTAEEIAAAGGFERAEGTEVRWARSLSVDEFVAMALTSTKTQAAVTVHGAEHVERSLHEIGKATAGNDGAVVIPYVTRLCWARRLSSHLGHEP